MKLSSLMKTLWPEKAPEPKLSSSEINRLIGQRGREYAEERLLAYDEKVRSANQRADMAGNLAKEQIASLQKMYPAFKVLFNSYYNAVGDKHPRPQRGYVPITKSTKRTRHCLHAGNR